MNTASPSQANLATNHDELSPPIVVRWLRSQGKRYAEAAQRCLESAEKYNQAADVLESMAEPPIRTATSPVGQGAPAPHSRTFQSVGRS